MSRRTISTAKIESGVGRRAFTSGDAFCMEQVVVKGSLVAVVETEVYDNLRNVEPERLRKRRFARPVRTTPMTKY
jgi:hypothetical protein